MRLLVVEDHAILRDGLRALLELESDLQIVGTVGDADAAVIAVRHLQPQLVLTDIALPGRSGIELIRELCALAPDLRIVVLTGHTSEEYIRAALNAGAHGYVLKDSGARSCCMPSGRRLRADNTCAPRLRRRWCPDSCTGMSRNMRCGRRSMSPDASARCSPVSPWGSPTRPSRENWD